MIGYTLPEIRRLLTGLVQRYLPDPAHMLASSNWRRKRQYRARVSHYRCARRRRGGRVGGGPAGPGPPQCGERGTLVNTTVSQVLSRISSVEL
jgi:hypothetical protein